MTKLCGWMRRRVGILALLVGGLAYASHALADTYNVLLKSQGAPVTCAEGGFTFDKVGPGSFPVTVTIKTGENGCLGLPGGTYTGTVDVVVENVIINGQPQGPSVVGLGPTPPAAPQVLVRTKGGGATIGLQYVAGSAQTPNPERPMTLFNGTTTTTSTYHLYNQAAPVPEPGMLLLVPAALGAIWAARRAKRRRGD